MTRKKKNSRLTKALLETADDMRRVGVVDAAAHEKITLRHLGGKAGVVTKPISGDEIRSFKINVSEEEIVDLRRRIKATRWPDKETVPDRSQGVQLAVLQELVRYWGTDYNWRKVETYLNSLPQFKT